MAIPQIPPLVFTALKAQQPGASDSDIAAAWPDLLEAASKNTGRDLSTEDPAQLASDIMKATKIPASSTDVPASPAPATLPQVTVTAPKDVDPEAAKLTVPNVDTPSVPNSPYAGAKFNSTDLLNQFDPAAMKAAQDDLNTRNANINTDRVPGAFLTGLTAGEPGGANAVNANNDYWKNQQDIAKQATVGAQQNLAAQAVQGIKAAGDIYDQAQKQSQYGIDRNKAVLEMTKSRSDLVNSLLDIKTKQQLGDASTDGSAAARVSVRQALVNSGNFTPQQALAMIPDTMTGLSASLAAGFIPGSTKAAVDAATAANTNAAAGKTAAGVPSEVAKGRIDTAAANTVAPGVGNGTPPIKAPYGSAAPSVMSGTVQPDTPTTGNPDADRIKTLLARSAGVPKAPAPSTNAPGNGLVLAPGAVPTINAGTVSISNPGAVATSTGNAAAALDQAKATQAYVTTVKPAFDDTRTMLDNVYSGKGALAIGKLANTDQAALMNKLAYLNSVSPNAMPENIRQSLAQAASNKDNPDNFNGTYLGTLTGDQLRAQIDAAEKSIQSNIGFQANKDTAVAKGANPAAAAAQQVPPTPAALPLKDANGWVLHRDKTTGAQAYVDPANPKNFKEVK